jgi:hypothetical protein
MTTRPLRAGDSDRSAVIDLLRAHHLDGRLSVEEFEQRIDAAQQALTLLELADLHDDLPELTPRRGKVVARNSRPPRIPGRYAFVERVQLDVDPALAREQALEFIAPALAKHGYVLSSAGDVLAFRRRWRPGWTILVAIVTFPIGLLALMVTEQDEVAVMIEPAAGGGTDLVAHGVAPLKVRRAFASLRD